MRPWFERRFRFDHLADTDFPFLVERLRGTPARIEDKTRGLPRELVARRAGGAWSILEHVGHLIDLDALHDARLDDYLAAASVLRAADPENRKTHGARHDLRPLAELTLALRRERERLVSRLEAWDPDRLSVVAFHPRLQQPMRLVDMLYFVAEHDDHHLAHVTDLVRDDSGRRPSAAPGREARAGR